MFPEMTSDDMDLLRGSIEKDGYSGPPIILFEGLVLDGVHRAKCCDALNVKPLVAEFVEDAETARDFVLRTNLVRRHLSQSQRALIAAKLVTARPGGQPKGGSPAPEAGGALAPPGATTIGGNSPGAPDRPGSPHPTKPVGQPASRQKTGAVTPPPFEPSPSRATDVVAPLPAVGDATGANPASQPEPAAKRVTTRVAADLLNVSERLVRQASALKRIHEATKAEDPGKAAEVEKLLAAVEAGEVGIARASKMAQCIARGEAAPAQLRDGKEHPTPALSVNSVIGEAVKQMLGRVDLDAAATAASREHIGAKRALSAEEALAADGWKGAVFCQQPHGPQGEALAERLLSELASGAVTRALWLGELGSPAVTPLLLSDRLWCICVLRPETLSTDEGPTADTVAARPWALLLFGEGLAKSFLSATGNLGRRFGRIGPH